MSQDWLLVIQATSRRLLLQDPLNISQRNVLWHVDGKQLEHVHTFSIAASSYQACNDLSDTGFVEKDRSKQRVPRWTFDTFKP